ncbi:protein-disulfide reductase DsbD family protein [Mesorhizobium sp. WSM4898]|uniref:protein-disulfide reductase DsbD domain-containing protein n=1 Tax=Mesorhizobium sp. WSM4898 TaxID=3038544 RepID=UPI0024157EE9|nr:protein-disulfide reductase DsbD domain-containing protein [Mesorhizobium sp. WSM4898]MDG4908860.1 protein-disulfide reductase DsbD family protein [Mesorhizobium sp. WSM4898]
MRYLNIVALGAVVGLAAGQPAEASSSAWYDSEGGKVRLVTSGKPDEAGKIHGVLDIALKPGWKTYWRDPGDAGVPPQIDISASTNIADAKLSFPPPQRHDDGYGKWAGYDRPVSLPVTFTLSAPDQPATIDANVFLGICETICIPVQTRLSLDPASDPDNATDAALVKTALATLPGPARSDFGIRVLPGDHETLIVEAHPPGDAESVDFFIAGERDYMFGAPVRSEKDGKLVFTVPILDRPSATPTDGGLYYTLTSAEGAVDGLLPFP